ncbi:MAG: V-type ATPase 116kDa subunit family protein [bacterium]
MFRPAKMAKIDLQVPQDHVAKTTHIVANLEVLHLMNVRKTRMGELESHADSNLLHKYTALKRRLEKIFPVLKIDQGNTGSASSSSSSMNSDNSSLNSAMEIIPDEELNPHKDILRIDQEVQRLEEIISGLAREAENIEKTRKEKEQLLRQLEILSTTGIDINRFHECRFLYAEAGLIPMENLGRLEFSLSNVYHLIVPSICFDKQRLIFVFGSRKDRHNIEKALKSAYFERMEVLRLNPDHNSHSAGFKSTRSTDFKGPHSANLCTDSSDNLDDVGRQIRELDAEKALIQDRLEAVKKQSTGQMRQLMRKIILAITVLEIEKSYDQVDHIYHISGWVPLNVFPSLEKKIAEATGHQVIITVASPNDICQAGDFFKIPTCFQNPFLLKPFEKLVAGYGIPSYGEVEPTFFFALIFLLMFGVMFGDVGQGIVLFLLGFLAFKQSGRENIQDMGLIVMECGIMSTAFGFLYGSVFGFEHLIPALWFNPMKNISYFMEVTIGFGMAIISIGLVLNIINSIRNRDYKGGIFGEFGIMGLVFYWGCIGLVLSCLATGKVPIHFGHLPLILCLPLLAIFLKEPLFNLYGRLMLKKNQPIIPEKPGIYFMESLIEVGDTIIAFLSHTVSFIRVSAFALAHAGLFLAVFTLARTLQNHTGGVVWYWLTMVLGNIGIITVEGLVVSIQTIRLEYYEFFTKFFHGGGEIYSPLRGI